LPSLSDAVAATGGNRNTVKKHLQKLVANGYLLKQGRGLRSAPAIGNLSLRNELQILPLRHNGTHHQQWNQHGLAQGTNEQKFQCGAYSERTAGWEAPASGDAIDTPDYEDPLARMDADFVLLSVTVQRLVENLKKLLGGYAVTD
jgi:hypothetical protein